jgi:hypothetical protein
MEVGRKGQRPFLRVEVCISIARDLHQVGNLTKRANRLCYTADKSLSYVLTSDHSSCSPV